MNYFLRTLEGLGYTNPYLSSPYVKYFNDIFREISAPSVSERYFETFKRFVKSYPEKNILDRAVKDVLNYIKDFENTPGQSGWVQIANNLSGWYTRYLRENYQKTFDREGYEEAMKAQAEAMQQAQAEALEQAQAGEETRRRQAEQAREDAAAAARAYSEAMKAQAEAMEQAQVEAMEQAQAEAMEQAQAEAVEQANEIINEGATMQELTLENQVIESTPTYTIIDETADSITYEDEAGNVHIEPKSNAATWLIIAAAAALFLA